MPNPNKLKQQFLKKWLVCLNSNTHSIKNMDFLERKKAIKMSADFAMAATRNRATFWSRAIIAKSIKGNSGQIPSQAILNRRAIIHAKLRRKTMMTTTLRKIGRRVGRKVARTHLPPSSKALASSVAKRLVEKRTKVLRSLVPGGEFMEDEVLLIEEALDYVSFLRAQVDGMRFLANNCQ